MCLVGSGQGGDRVGRSSYGLRPLPPPGSPMRPSLADGETPAALSTLGGLPKPTAAARTLTGRAPVRWGLPSGRAREQPWPRRGPLCLVSLQTRRGVLSVGARCPAGLGGFRPAKWGVLGTGGWTKPRPRCPHPVSERRDPARQGFAPRGPCLGRRGTGGRRLGRQLGEGRGSPRRPHHGLDPMGKVGSRISLDPGSPWGVSPAVCVWASVSLCVAQVIAFLGGFQERKVNGHQFRTLEARAGPGRAEDGLPTGRSTPTPGSGCPKRGPGGSAGDGSRLFPLELPNLSGMLRAGT